MELLYKLNSNERTNYCLAAFVLLISKIQIKYKEIEGDRWTLTQTYTMRDTDIDRATDREE